jgi:uncharacterized protein (TIGR03067 family)
VSIPLAGLAEWPATGFGDSFSYLFKEHCVMRAFATVLGLILMAVPVGAFQENVKTAKMKLQGTWLLKDVQLTSQETTRKLAKTMKGIKLTFSGDKVTAKGGLTEGPISYRVDPTKSPKEMDWIVKGADGKPVVMKGVYEITGNRLTTCFGAISKGRKGKADIPAPRPRNLKPATDDDIQLVFEREKP